LKDTLWLFNIAMENGPFIDDLPSKHGAGFPQLDYRRVCANHVNGILQYILSDWTRKLMQKHGEIPERKQKTWISWMGPRVIMAMCYLVGGTPTPLKNMKVNGKDYPIYCRK